VLGSGAGEERFPEVFLEGQKVAAEVQRVFVGGGVKSGTFTTVKKTFSLPATKKELFHRRRSATCEGSVRTRGHRKERSSGRNYDLLRECDLARTLAKKQKQSWTKDA